MQGKGLNPGNISLAHSEVRWNLIWFTSIHPLAQIVCVFFDNMRYNFYWFLISSFLLQVVRQVFHYFYFDLFFKYFLTFPVWFVAHERGKLPSFRGESFALSLFIYLKYQFCFSWLTSVETIVCICISKVCFIWVLVQSPWKTKMSLKLLEYKI